MPSPKSGDGIQRATFNFTSAILPAKETFPPPNDFLHLNGIKMLTARLGALIQINPGVSTGVPELEALIT